MARGRAGRAVRARAICRGAPAAIFAGTRGAAALPTRRPAPPPCSCPSRCLLGPPAAVASSSPRRPSFRSRLGACALRRGGERLPAAIPTVAGAMRTQYVMRYVEVAPGTGAPAEPGQVYAVHYTGWLRDGTRFDSSRDRGEPIRFEQGKRRVIPGWDAGFEGMRVGGRRASSSPTSSPTGSRAARPASRPAPS
jgi:hypothetical protein